MLMRDAGLLSKTKACEAVKRRSIYSQKDLSSVYRHAAYNCNSDMSSHNSGQPRG